MVRVNYVFHGECNESCITESCPLEGYGEVGVSIAASGSASSSRHSGNCCISSLHFSLGMKWEVPPYSYSEESDKLIHKSSGFNSSTLFSRLMEKVPYGVLIQNISPILYRPWRSNLFPLHRGKHFLCDLDLLCEMEKTSLTDLFYLCIY